MDKISYIIVHHTGAEEKDAGQVRRYHLSLGWRDVGYHYLIERDGRVVDGRPPHTVGAHCTADNMNQKSIGVAVIGNLEQRPPTAAQAKSLAALASKLAVLHQVSAAHVLGHGEVPGAATACPGQHLNLTQLRCAVAEAIAASPQGQLDTNKLDIKPQPQKLWRVQVGAYSSLEAAQQQAQKLRQLGYDVWVVSSW